MPTGCADYIDCPELAASSSSEKSGVGEEKGASSTKRKLSKLSDKMKSACQADPGGSSCYMDAVCGQITFEKEQKPAEPSRSAALSEMGELLAIEGPPPPKPWTEQLSDKVLEARTAMSSKTSSLFFALGLSAKKDQALITDFYPAKLVEKQKQKNEEENKEPLNPASFSAQNLLASGMSAVGLGPKEEIKEKKQTLITDFDSNKAPSTAKVEESAEAVAGTETEPEKREIPDVPDIPSLPTIATEIENASREDVEERKWSLWKQVKGFMSKFKMPDKVSASTCDVPAKVEVTPWTLPYFGVFSCNPQTFKEEPTAKAAKTVEEQVMVEVSKVKVTTIEETKVEETTVHETNKVDDVVAEGTKVEETTVAETNKVDDVVAEDRERESRGEREE